jgi:hypothetical protein
MGFCGRRKGRKAFFFEKKKQKTFALWFARRVWRKRQVIKVFCFFSSEKKNFLSGHRRMRPINTAEG